MQYFKGDPLEIKLDACGSEILTALSLHRQLFSEGAYDSFPLGELIYDQDRSPLSNAIIRDIFREAFNEIFVSFTLAGTFESYVDVFKKIFGDDVEITFTVPAPGKLQIDIVAMGIDVSPFVTRTIEDDQFVHDNVVDDVGDNICFQTVMGFESQYELEQMLFEMVPAGVYTIITLTVGA